MNDSQSLFRWRIILLNIKQGEKYQSILQAAIEVIASKGIEKTSISDIVKQAGVAQGTFYLYFSSKNALIPAIADQLLQQLFDEVQQKTEKLTSFWKKLQVVIDVTFEMTDMNKEVLILCYAGLAFEHSFEKWEGIYFPYYKWFENELKSAIEKSDVIEALSIETTVRMIINVIEQTAEGLYFSQDKERNGRTVQLKKDVFIFIQRALT